MKAEIKEKNVEKYLQSVSTHIEKSREAIGDMVITDDADYAAICDTLFSVAEYKAGVAEEKEKVTGAAKLIIATVNKWFGPREKAIADHEAELKARVRKYNIEREEERTRLLKSATKIAKLDAAKARELNAQADSVLAPKVKGISFVGKVDVEVTDQSKLPDQYFTRIVDEVKLKAAVESGEITEKNAADFGVLIIDNRTVRVTPSQRQET